MPRFSPLAMLGLLVAAACQDGGTAVRPDTPNPDPRVEGFLVSGPVQSGWIIGRDGWPMEVVYEIHDGHAIWQGDIDLGPVEMISPTAEEAGRRSSSARLGIAVDGSATRWPDGVVPYQIPLGFPDANRISAAIAHIEANNAGVDFVVRTTQTDYVAFRESTGCSSAVGRAGGLQIVRLSSNCSTGNTIHELLHALGMKHEQARCDRDSYVTIQTANILSGKEHNFVKWCDGFTDYESYAEGSIMHYPPYAFSSNDQPTIVSKRGLDSAMGQRSGMNGTDISTIDILYPPHDQGGGG